MNKTFVWMSDLSLYGFFHIFPDLMTIKAFIKHLLKSDEYETEPQKQSNNSNLVFHSLSVLLGYHMLNKCKQRLLRSDVFTINTIECDQNKGSSLNQFSLSQNNSD